MYVHAYMNKLMNESIYLHQQILYIVTTFLINTTKAYIPAQNELCKSHAVSLF